MQESTKVNAQIDATNIFKILQQNKTRFVYVILIGTFSSQDENGNTAEIIVAAFFLLFNLIGIPSYPSAYDKFLLAVSLVFNGVTIWLAWNW